MKRTITAAAVAALLCAATPAAAQFDGVLFGTFNAGPQGPTRTIPTGPQPHEIEPAAGIAALDSAGIASIQRVLGGAGYYRGAAHGTMDAATINALRDFQHAHGLDTHGQPDAFTLDALGLGVRFGHSAGGHFNN